MKDDVLGTVRALVRLAAESENIEEARNAALQACRLMHKHQLLDASGSGTFVRPSPKQEQQDVEDFIEDLAAGHVDLSALFGDFFGNERPTRRGGTRSRPTPPAAPPPQPKVTRPQPRTKDPDAKEIPVLDPAFCQSCGQRILRGRFAVWSRGSLFHRTCWNNATG